MSQGILSGWKDIANYLGKGVRTVQRYERELGFPIRRPAGKSKGSVIATKAELDGWVIARPIREKFLLPRSNGGHVALLREFRRNVQEMRRLRQESAELREELYGALVLLSESVRCLRRRATQVYVGTWPPKINLGPRIEQPAAHQVPKNLGNAQRFAG